MISLVIFDCDGVLIDSESISASVLIQELKTINISLGFEYVLENFLGRSFVEVAADIRKKFGSLLPVEFEEQYRKKLINEFKQNLNTTAGIEDILNNLNVTSCVATSSSPARVDRSLELVGLKPYFKSNVFTVSEVSRGKPAPDLFLHVAQSMQVKPEHCLVIEDSSYGVQAALSAKMEVLRYTGGSHYAQSLQFQMPEQSPAIIFTTWSEFFTIKPELKKD